MASSMSRVHEAEPGQILTSGSDAGTLPPLCDIFVIEEGAADQSQVLDALSTTPDPEVGADIILRCIEKAVVGGGPPRLEALVEQLAHHLLVSPVEVVPEAVRLYLVDLSPEELPKYVEEHLGWACNRAAVGLLPTETSQKLLDLLPPMVVYAALQNERLAHFPEAQTLTPLYRRKNLSSLLELKSSEASPFSEGWTARLFQRRSKVSRQTAGGPASLQQAAPAQHFHGFNHRSTSSPPRRSVSRERGEISSGRSPGALNLTPPSHGSRVTLRPNPDAISNGDRRVASRDADKASSAFKGGPFKGVDDERGLSGFWRQVESLVVRRGWQIGGPEHYFLLTNLVPEYTLEEAVGRKNPVTLVDFSTSVADIRSALAEECGGHFEVEKLLSEPTARSNQETLTSYIGRLDEWARRCALAGAPLGDGHVIRRSVRE
ncbi:hypothetical protein Pmar_PMAR013163 [Perkinsus marinus ATCC 50983]|uniref:Uncharacterized protein n=2 Tax=Perkinsus marinus (strain ATCC 50983 / TXsc) TaxID=423536 RepID=C5KBI6_PERM5|nr:hypothetical protein Pmar_PMAR013163 [Perkinsus marinus ATCC 50983]EER18157.1 hypothetical protein Pmar_PMAR013163 [Perkinsus marinus ATCC 50983]|eukprot:XP_002786361.1 hypothetical protein Pmar_PMAR013163 [Perkinsus marinus ATCC 50983]